MEQQQQQQQQEHGQQSAADGPQIEQIPLNHHQQLQLELLQLQPEHQQAHLQPQAC